MDSSHSVGNGFAYQGKISSSKLTSVLEAVAGEYALVINGHSLVRLPSLACSRLSAGECSDLVECFPQLLCSLFREDDTGYALPQYGLAVLSCSQLPLT